MKKILLFPAIIISQILMAQNVGIGTNTPVQKLHVEGASFLNGSVGIGNSTPQFPLSFNGSIGDKISLWNDGTLTHYGFGIQSGLLQIFAKTDFDKIAFGYGSSSSFSERARIINSGADGMILNGRVVLKNGTTDINNGGGAWLYKADNSALLGFMGTQNNQNIGFYGGPAGWGFTYDAINSRIGIGNNNPNAPLSFSAAFGKKITLYPGATGDVGLAVAGNGLQVYADNPNADVAIGYDAAGTFNERFAFKANGAIAIYGNTGNAGQLLQSNGSGGASQWVNPVDPATLKTQYYQTYINPVTLTNTSSSLNINVPVTVYANSIITVSVTVNVSTASYSGCVNGELGIAVEPLGGGGLFTSIGKFTTICGSTKNTVTTGEVPLVIGNGTMKIFGPGTGVGAIIHLVKTNNGPDLTIGNATPALIIVKVVPQ